MTHIDKLEKLCLEVIENNYDNKCGLSYYPHFSIQLKEYNPIDIIITIMRIYDLQSAKEFLLSLPFLWTTLTSSDWIYIMENATRRAPRIDHDENADFLDIFVLSQYFRLDALTFFVKHTKSKTRVKELVYRYFYRFPDLICYDSLSLEYLDGKYLVKKSIVETTAYRLISEGKIQKLNLKYKNSEKYLTQIKFLIDNVACHD